MKLSPSGRRLIQGFEGLSLTAYPDPKLAKVGGQWAPNQRWSIGYGHQLPGGKVWEGTQISREQADAYFDQDVVSRELAVSLLTPDASQAQFDAMVSLAYNIGIGDTSRRTDGGFATSTVQRLHNAGDFAGAADAFRLWRKAGGAVNPVLVDRRERERNVYLHGYPTFPGPVQEPAAPVAANDAPAASSPAPKLTVRLAPIVAGLAAVVFFCPACSARLVVEAAR